MHPGEAVMRCGREGGYLVPSTRYLVTPTGELEGGESCSLVG